MVCFTMAMKIVKLDRRYTGGRQFDYAVEFTHPFKDGELFCEVREWCWETWGPGRELKFVDINSKDHWCFMTDNYRTRIYLSDTPEVEWLTLRWSECIYRKK